MLRFFIFASGFLFANLFSYSSLATQKIIFAAQPSYVESFHKGELEHNPVVRLARQLNLEVEMYECPWARCLKAIELGDADIIDDLFYAEDRDAFTYYLQPHFDVQDAGFRFFADNTRISQITSWDELKKLRVGSLRGYKHFPLFDNDPELVRIETNSIETLVGLLLKGRIDVLIAAPSFDEDSIRPFDPEGKLARQPYAHRESIPLYLGLSRNSDWYHNRGMLESGLKAILEKPNSE